MDMVVYDSNHRKWGTYEHFIVILGNKLYVSRHCDDADKIQDAADRLGLPFIWQRFSNYVNLAPECVRDQEPGYRDYISGFGYNMFYEFNINKTPYSWEWQAKEYFKKNSQDTHSKEYHKWLDEQAVYYNNGFYEWDEKHFPKEERWRREPLRNSKAIAEIINRNCKTLYTGSMREGTQYGTRDGFCTIVERKGKYIAFGEGGEICASDCMTFYMFWQKDTLTELIKCLENSKYKLTESNKDVTEKFVEFVIRHKPKDFAL